VSEDALPPAGLTAREASCFVLALLFWFGLTSILGPPLSGVDVFIFKEAGANLALHRGYVASGVPGSTDLIPHLYAGYTPGYPFLFGVFAAFAGVGAYSSAYFDLILASMDRAMLIRSRKSRIYFLRQFFDYPIQLTAQTIRQLGMMRMAKIGTSYTASLLHQIKPEKTLEEFLINRFGKELYLTLFEILYREGVGCSLRSDQRGVGSTAYKRPLDHEGGRTLSQEGARAEGRWRYRAEADGNFSD
jgi:hypothetical protein